MEKAILSGNEAIARGAFEAGVRVASAYPGTPSTEILETIVHYPEIDASWAPNEKVALEVGIGASFAGARALVAMKHVGVNVAADPLFTFAYTGVGGGLVLITADDPEMHSSQNEQDNRNYARFAKVPMLEPADSQECKDFTRLALELAEEYDTPVMLRTTTRISHSKSVVNLGERVTGLPEPRLEKNAAKLVMLPGNARRRHPLVEARQERLAAAGATMAINRLEARGPELGVITSGVCYNYVREVLPGASVLKLGLVNPLPKELIRRFAAQVKTLIVVEELDPFIEEQVRAMGLACHGKDLLPICGELTPGLLRKAFAAAGFPVSAGLEELATAPQLPPRPPNMCPGCPHRGIFYTLKQLKAYVSGDIGCYTLGGLPPISAMHSSICMGASISAAHGMAKVNGIAGRTEKPVAVIGDSTFFHSGMTGLLSLAYNNGNALVVIMDNRATAMTGGQENPGSGRVLEGEPAKQVDITAIVKALGIDQVAGIDSYNLEETEAAIRKGLETPGPYVLIDKNPCILRYRVKKPLLSVDADKCTGCRACLKVTCVALGLVPFGDKQKVQIDPNICNGCGVCSQVCKFDAMSVRQG